MVLTKCVRTLTGLNSNLPAGLLQASAEQPQGKPGRSRQPQLFALLLLPQVDLFDAGAAQHAPPLLAVDRNEDGIGGGGGACVVPVAVVILIIAGGGGSAGTKVFVKGENLDSKVVVFHAQRVPALKIFCSSIDGTVVSQ
jgi:hypothetical protein